MKKNGPPKRAILTPGVAWSRLSGPLMLCLKPQTKAGFRRKQGKCATSFDGCEQSCLRTRAELLTSSGPLVSHALQDFSLTALLRCHLSKQGGQVFSQAAGSLGLFLVSGHCSAGLRGCWVSTGAVRPDDAPMPTPPADWLLVVLLSFPVVSNISVTLLVL